MELTTITIAFDPVLLRVGPFELGWHGLFTGLALFVGVWYGLRGAALHGVPSERLGRVLTWAIVGGIIGARALHVADHVTYYAEHPLATLAIYEGGIAVYGGFVGGLAGGLLAARGSNLPVWPLLDTAAPAMLISQAIGRLGCLANGDAWGAPTGGGFGIVYTHPNDLLPRELLGVATHPYPLYEMGAVLLLLALLALGARYVKLREGAVFLLAVIGYAAIRFALSFYRQETTIIFGWQEAQLIAAATLLCAITAWILRSRGPMSRPLAAVTGGS